MEKVFSKWNIRGLFGAGAVLLDECESTHRWLKQEHKNLQAGTVVVADFQTAGTGRHSRVWTAPKGKNLLFNILLSTEKLRPELYACTTQIAAITLAGIIEKMGISAAVKWPNDILVNRRKICGIISEVLPGALLSVGIGLNVNVERSDLEGIDKPATSLFIESGCLHDREEILRDFLLEFESNFVLLCEKGLTPWLVQWRKFDCFTGTSARVSEKGKVLEGVIEGIQDDGSLLFRTEQGLQTIWSGDLDI